MNASSGAPGERTHFGRHHTIMYGMCSCEISEQICLLAKTEIRSLLKDKNHGMQEVLFDRKHLQYYTADDSTTAGTFNMATSYQ